MKVRTEFIVLALLLVFMTGCLPLPSLDQENVAEDMEHTDYLLAYYPFDDSTKDSGKNGYHGVPIGAPTYDEDTPSGSGKALKLNGFKGQYVNVPYPFLNGLNEYSVSFWIKDFGMGMVFLFLIVMICAMKLLEIVVRPFARAQEAKAAAAAAAKKPAAKSDDLNLAAVAAAAVELFRRK